MVIVLVPLTRRSWQNRTKVGLKLMPQQDKITRFLRQNRTKVGLKLVAIRVICGVCNWAKSNQGGIETGDLHVQGRRGAQGKIEPRWD